MSYLLFQAKWGAKDILKSVFIWLRDARGGEERFGKIEFPKTFWRSTREGRRAQTNGATTQATWYLGYHVDWYAETTPDLKPTDPTWEWQTKMSSQEDPCYRMCESYEKQARRDISIAEYMPIGFGDLGTDEERKALIEKWIGKTILPIAQYLFTDKHWESSEFILTELNAPDNPKENREPFQITIGL